MAGGTGLILFALAFLGCFTVSLGGETCTTSEYHYGYNKYSTTYCAYDCCGYWPNQYCCNVGAGLIVGIIFAVIVGICVTVALVCCCIKKQGASGRVVAPVQGVNNGPNVTVVHSSNTSGQYPVAGYGQPVYPNYGQPVQPPPYGNAGAPPPAYAYTNPPPAAGASNPFAQAANSKS